MTWLLLGLVLYLAGTVLIGAICGTVTAPDDEELQRCNPYARLER